METSDEEKVCPSSAKFGDDDKLLLPNLSNHFSKIPMFVLLQALRVALLERKCGFYLCHSRMMDFSCIHGFS